VFVLQNVSFNLIKLSRHNGTNSATPLLKLDSILRLQNSALHLDFIASHDNPPVLAMTLKLAAISLWSLLVWEKASQLREVSIVVSSMV